MKKVTSCFLIFFCSLVCSLQAQVLWDFRGGVSYGKWNYDDYSEKYWNYMGELGIDIPLKKKFALDIALRYKNICHIDAWDYELTEDNSYWGNYDEEEKTRASILELPFRLGYKIPLSKYSLIRLSVGPYVSAGLNDGFRLYQVGGTTGVTYEYKKINIGLNYNVAIHKAFDNVASNGVYLTLGVKFKSSAWKSIGAVTAAIGTTAIAVGNAVSTEKTQAVEKNAGYDNSSEISDYTPNVVSESEPSTASSKKREAKKKELDEKTKKLEKQTAYRMSGKYASLDFAYDGYYNQLLKMKTYPEKYSSQSYCSDIKYIQAQMKSIREKMDKYGGGKKAKADLEDWNPCR